MKPSIYIPQRELDKLERKTNQILKELSKEKKGILLAAARYIRDGIKQNAPVGPTGNLKKAAYATAYPATMRSPAIAFAGVRPRRAPHAHLVEYGHGGPRPGAPLCPAGY